MKVYFLKRRGKNWLGNFPLHLHIQVLTGASGDNLHSAYTDYLFYRKRDAEAYRSTFDNKYGNPFEVWSAEVKHDPRDMRRQ